MGTVEAGFSVSHGSNPPAREKHSWGALTASRDVSPEMARAIQGEQGATAGLGEMKVSAFPQHPTSHSVASVLLHF